MLLAEIDLLPGEIIQYTLQANGFFLGASPILKALAAIQAFFVTLTAGFICILFVVTNQRVFVLQASQVGCGWSRVEGANAISFASVAEVGFAKETQACCIHSRVAHIESKTQRDTMIVKKVPDSELKIFLSNVSAVIVGNAQMRTAT